MKSRELIEDIKITDIDNFFDVYEDTNGNYSYNLNETVFLNVDKSSMNTYILTTDSYWPLISYKIYNTTRLFWLLMKLNGVKNGQVFSKKHAGDEIKYLSIDVVKTIIQQIQ